MKMIMKTAAIAGLAGILAVGAMTPSQARGRWVAPAAGFAAGALVGAAAANAAASNSYYYGEPAYDSYAYSPGYVAVEPAPAYGYNNYGYNNRYGYTGDSNYTGPWHERQLEGRDW